MNVHSGVKELVESRRGTLFVTRCARLVARNPRLCYFSGVYSPLMCMGTIKELLSPYSTQC